jgi:hypothetical protein
MTAQEKITGTQTVENVLTDMDEREAWRPGLIAYWQREHCGERAMRLKRGEPFDYLDVQAIEAIEAAVAAVREAA